MILYFKNINFLLFIILIKVTCLISCSTRDKASTEIKPSEEKIKYVFPVGRYQIDIINLVDYKKSHEDADGYIEPWKINKEKIVDANGNITNIMDIVTVVETQHMGTMFQFNRNIEGYKIVRKAYDVRNIDEFYCTKVQPETIPEDLIFDNSLIVRLYDKNNNVISENPMRKNIDFEDYKKNPQKYKIKPYGSTQDVFLIGMLELPPKEQRQGLKYRVVNLSSREEESHLEKELTPYSVYNRFNFFQESGCYSHSRNPTDKRIKIIWQ